MPRKRFAGKSMRAEKGVTVKTGVDVVFRKRTRGKRMVFGPIRAQKAEEKAPAAQEVSKTRQLSFDDYGPRGLAQRRIEDFKRYPAKKRGFRKEKSLAKKKAEEAAEIVELVREEMAKPGAVRIKEPWKEESLPYKVKKKMQKEFPEVAERLGRVKAMKKSEEVAAAAYGKVFKEEEKVKKKVAGSEGKQAKLPAVEVKDVVMLLAFLFALVLFLAILSWIASIF